MGLKLAMLLRADGSFSVVMPEDGRSFKLEELQKLVGGYIQIVPSTQEGKVMVINEEGKVDDLPYNERATSIYTYGSHDYIVGDVLLCGAELVE